MRSRRLFLILPLIFLVITGMHVPFGPTETTDRELTDSQGF